MLEAPATILAASASDMPRSSLSIPLATLVALAALGACARAQPPTPTPAQAPAASTARAKDYVPADVHFMHGMIGHHQQAVVMAAMVPTHGASERVQLFAKKVDLSQRDEMAMMQRWLEDRGEPVSAPHDHHGAMHMPGMLTAEQLAQLDRARGAEFDRLFLTFMIQHHEGALVMVDELFRAPRGGQEPELFRLVSDIAADQRGEIDVMQQLLSALPTNRSPTP